MLSSTAQGNPHDFNACLNCSAKANGWSLVDVHCVHCVHCVLGSPHGDRKDNKTDQDRVIEMFY